MIPDRIFIDEDLIVYHCLTDRHDGDLEYIRKDALLEKINEQIKTSEDLKAEGRGDVFYTAEIDAFEQTKRIIESL